VIAVAVVKAVLAASLNSTKNVVDAGADVVAAASAAAVDAAVVVAATAVAFETEIVDVVDESDSPSFAFVAAEEENMDMTWPR
jgi:hypothetical protein